MADHQWFVPVSGGRGYNMTEMDTTRATPSEPYNVQWDFKNFPDSAAKSCVDAASATTMNWGSSVGPTPSKLSVCYGMWNWRSCSDGQNVTVGGQLAVGTVFSRIVNRYINNPAPPPLIIADAPASYSWNRVDAWVKFMLVSTNINMYDNVFFTINDPVAANAVGLNAAPINWIGAGTVPPLAINTWFVAHAWKSGGWGPEPPDWDDDNLRATLSVQGTSVAANVGPVGVNVEWFAFRLSEQD